MLFAPLPPPVGGITSITAMLHRELGETSEVLFVQPVAKTSSWKRLVRPALSVVRLIVGTLRVKQGGRVVFFCSSRASFWDKCAWAAIVLLLRRNPVMVMVAGDFPETFAASPSWARRSAEWLMRRRRLTVAAQSASWAERYRGIFPGAAVTQVGATVDPAFFDAASGAKTSGDPLTLLFVGWIIHDKGILDLLDAVAEAAPVLAGRVQLRLVGPLFGREAYWQDEIDRRNLGALVQLAGVVTDRAALLREYRDADAFVFPSHYEGFPVALLEAAASGLACVATDVGGVGDILGDGVAGLIVPPKAPSALAAALARIVADPILRDRLGAAAAARARDEFSRDACLASYERVLGLR